MDGGEGAFPGFEPGGRTTAGSKRTRARERVKLLLDTVIGPGDVQGLLLFPGPLVANWSQMWGDNMGVKKRYPEPHRRSDSKIYYFICLGKDGRRRKVSTGLTAKEEARRLLHSFIDEQSAEATTLTGVSSFGRALSSPHGLLADDRRLAAATSMSTGLTLDALEQALRARRITGNLVHHSDRGSQGGFKRSSPSGIPNDRARPESRHRADRSDRSAMPTIMR